MEAKRYNRKTDDHDDDRRDALSLRPPSRRSPHDNSTLQSRNERRRKEHNPNEDPRSHARTAPLRPFARSSGKADQEDRKFPGHIHIDDEEEEKQDIVTSRPSQRVIGGEPQQMYPGAVAIQGPGFASSDQSIAGTILVGDQIPNEPSTRENQNLVIAAVVVPNEADEVARMENEIERRVRDQFDRFLQQTPRAETATAKFRLAHLEPAKKKRVVYLISILTVIIVIVVVITVAVLLSKSSAEDDNELVLQCSAISPCNLDHADANCTNGQCMIDKCELNYDNCNIDANDGCEVNLQTDKNHCGFCGNRCDLSNANSRCVDGVCAVDTCVPGYGDCDEEASTGCELDLLSNEDHCGSCTNKCSTGDSCANGACVNLQRLALMSLYESTNGPNWNTDAQMNWGLPDVNECEWHGVMCRSGKVTHLNKNNGNLTGKIPTDVGLLTELTYLDMYGNDLSGQIPSALGSLTKLTFLSLSYNELTGTIPTEMGRLTRLDVLSSSANRLTGTLPPEIASSTKLSRLFLSRNELTGTIPIEIGSLTNMQQLYLDKNLLIGTLPSEMARMTKLTNLYVHNNNLESIPTEICNMNLSIFWGDCPPCSLECCTSC